MKTDSRIIKPINPIAKELHRYKPQVIPNKKKVMLVYLILIRM